MHIKHIHDMVEKLSECAKCELDKGIEQLDTKEMGEVAEIIKELCEAEYYAKISKAMDEAEYGEDYDYKGAYDDNSRRSYRGQPRNSMGQFMSRRGRGRRGYTEPMYYTEPYPMEMMSEEMRDMDRMDGRLYFPNTSGGGSNQSSENMNGGGSSSGSQGGSSNSGGSRNYGGESGNSSNNMRDSREGRSGMSRRGYMETKEMHKGNTAEDKQAKMKELEKYMGELSGDITEMISDATPEEKSMLKSKLQALIPKI